MGVQVDVTSRTEGTATGDLAGVPVLVKYDTRLREKGQENVNSITEAVQVRDASLTHSGTQVSQEHLNTLCAPVVDAYAEINQDSRSLTPVQFSDLGLNF